MARQIASVHLDIARFVLEVSDFSEDSVESMEKLGRWTKRLARCLATRNPTLHEYGSLLLAEVEEYRKADSNRKKPKVSMDSADSTECDPIPRIPHTDQSRSDRSIKKESARGAEGEGGEKYPEGSEPLLAAKGLWTYVKAWSEGQAAEPSPSKFQAWAREFDLLFRVDGRKPDHLADLLQWLDEQPESKDGFAWRKVIRSAGALRKRWQEGKFNGFRPRELRGRELQ